MSIRIILVLIIWASVINAQDSTYFRVPVDHALRMSGSFGELRSNHFHAGIDIKSSNGRSGDPIVAAADGYVSRIKVQYGGYGNALYIDHPNGYTTVYAHLDKFDQTIDSLVRAMQYDHKSYEIDIYTEPNRYHYSKGEYIGDLGNTGRSFGPHLHFEIRKTAEEIPINPYQFGIGATDSRPPLLYSMTIVEKDANGNVVKTANQKLSPKKGNQYGPNKNYEVNGSHIGLEIQAFDRMDGASNLNGIYDLKMYVDEELYYHHTMEEVPFHHTRYINSHIDYKEKIDHNKTLIRCYKHPGNLLEFYNTNESNGIINMVDSDRKNIKIEVKDYYGNTSTYLCSITKGDSSGDISPSYQKLVKQGQEDTVSLYSTRFIFGENSLDQNLFFNVKEDLSKANTMNFVWGNSTTPIFTPIKVAVDVSGIDTSYWKKLILLHKDDKRRTSYGGTVENGRLNAHIDRFGYFKILIDDQPPTIKAINSKSTYAKSEVIKYKIEDEYGSRLDAEDMSFDIYIDDEWQIVPYSVLTNVVKIPLSHLGSGEHKLHIVAKDHSGNITSINKTFKI